MFVRSEIEHTLRLPPHLLNRPLNVAIKGELESLFLDKVIGKLGLCVSVCDILSIDGGFIFPGDGASTYTVFSVWNEFKFPSEPLLKWYQKMDILNKKFHFLSPHFPLSRSTEETKGKARFRLVMFRPYVGEVISARLKESTRDGLRLSLGFFNDIYVPVPLMPNPYHIEPDPEHKNGIKWVWEYMGENYPIDWMDEIRFSVHSVNYSPIPMEQGKDSEQKDSEENGLRQKDIKPFAPMVITGFGSSLNALSDVEYGSLRDCLVVIEKIKGSLDADGLGPIAWWV